MNRESTIDHLLTIAEQTQQVQSDRIQIVLDERKKDPFPPMSKALMETRSGLTRRKLDDAIAKMEQDGHQFTKNNANHYSLTLPEAHQIMDYANIPAFHQKKNHEHKPWIINIQNQKGGTGKSMSAVHMAASLALNIEKRYRICLIDLDPQGSLRLFLNPQISSSSQDNIYSAVDVMLDNIPDDETIDREFLLEKVCLPTQYPNLKTIAAFPEDSMFNAEAWQDLAENQSLDGVVKLLKEKVIDRISDDFDIIMIDTGPHVDPLVWNAMYASNALLIPCAAKRLDWSATVNFFQHLPTVYQMFPKDWGGLKFIRLMPTMFEDDNKKQMSVLTEMNYLLREIVMMATIPRSRAFETCADTYSTVYDLTIHDFEGGKRTLQSAQEAIQKVGLEFERVLHSYWSTLKKDM